GAHLAISIERLVARCDRPPQRIGLSATQRPLDEVARFLGGAELTQGSRLKAHGSRLTTQASRLRANGTHTNAQGSRLAHPGSTADATGEIAEEFAAHSRIVR